MAEIWKAVPRFPNYEVSSFGRVRNSSGKILKKMKNERGGNYPYVNLYRRGKRYNKNVHDLVAAAFLGRRPKDCDVHHKDENRGNSSLDNLEYKNEHMHLSEHKKKIV